MMPLRISLPPHLFLIHSISFQLRRGSNCSAVQDDKDDRSLTPLAWPTMLPKPRRLVPSMFRHQRGLVARLMRLARVGLGGVDKPRSEEHTSELQSLMRISYAVFCLKKKNERH